MVKTHVIDASCKALPKVDYLPRNANYACQRDRPADPVDLEFELEDDKVPEDFIKADIAVSIRHRACKYQLCIRFSNDITCIL